MLLSIFLALWAAHVQPAVDGLARCSPPTLGIPRGEFARDVSTDPRPPHVRRP